MQRIPQPLRKNYPAVRLYLDDVEDLYKLFQENCDQVTIKAEGYKLQSLDDLKGLGLRQIKHLDISGYKGSIYLFVDLRPYLAQSYVERDDDNALLGLFTRIDTILKRKARLLHLLFAPAVFIVFLFLVIGMSCVMGGLAASTLGHDLRAIALNPKATGHFTPFTAGDLWPPLVILLYMAYTVQGYMLTNRTRSVIYLYRWHERSNFWERHKETILRDIIVSVISSGIIGILAFIAGYLTGTHH